jgi:hypothetical protein
MLYYIPDIVVVNDIDNDGILFQPSENPKGID